MPSIEIDLEDLERKSINIIEKQLEYLKYHRPPGTS